MINLNFSWKKVAIAVLCASVFSLSASMSHAGGFPYVTPPRWSPDGSKVAIAINNGVTVRDAATNQVLYMLSEHTDLVSMVAWSPDSSMIATASYDQTVKLWSATDGALRHTLSGHNEAVTAVVWSPDGTRLLSWGLDTRTNLFVWDVATGTLLERHNGGSTVAAAFSPDRQRLAIADQLAVFVLDGLSFEVLSGSPHVLCCPNTMFSITWSPDGAQLVTGSLNGLVTIWDENTAQILKQFVANSHYKPDSRDVDNLALSWVRDVTFAPDGSTVLSVSGDGTVREWEAATGRLVQETPIMPLAGAAWSPYTGRLAVVDLTTRSGVTLSDEQVFDASDLAGHLNVVVPFATSDRLERLAEGCGVPTTAAQALAQQAQGTDHAGLERELTALTLPPACEADLRAVAEAIP